MHHSTPLISTIVAGLVLAYIFGMIANRLKMPPLVGYLVAGVLVGPHTPGFVADQALGAELAELGVILLMFGVGLHFSLKDLMSVRALAIPGAIAQIALATLLGLGLGLLMGWGVGAGLLFGLALSVASTVVLLKAMQDRRLVETERGRIAVGWLIVEDLAMVLALVLIPAIATSLGAGTDVVHDPFVSFVERMIGGPVGIWGVLALTIVKVAAFVGFMLIVGRRLIPWALHYTAHTGSRELFRLAVLAIALGVALGSAVLFGVSLALGAFFAGMILSESELSHRAAQETLPLRDAFAVLFFVSVGMLFDPAIIVTNPLPVLATVFIIVIGKSLAAFAIVLLFKRPIATALTISASLAQIGEFSFILASLGVSLAILPQEGQDLILAGALISIVLNPLVFWGVDLVKPQLEARVAQRRAARFEKDGVRIEPVETLDAAKGPITTDAPSEPLIDTAIADTLDDTPTATNQTGHTILVGFGRVGRVIGTGLHAANAPLVVIEDADHAVAAARDAGIEVVVGNAASAEVLHLANLEAAKCLMIAIPNGFEAGTICELGRKLSPPIRIIARAHSEEEEAHLRNLGADTIIMGEREIGLGMLAWLRGERVEETVAVEEPTEITLPLGDNLLDKTAAAGAIAVLPAATIIEVTSLEPPIGDDVLDETAADVPVIDAPILDYATDLAEPAEPLSDIAPAELIEIEEDPVIIASVEATPAAPVVALHEGRAIDDLPAATLETSELAPEVGEAPTAIDDAIPLADDAAPQPDTVITIEDLAPSPDLDPVFSPETQSDTPEPDLADAEADSDFDGVDDWIEPEDEPEIDTVLDDEPQLDPDEDVEKPAGIVPPVVPEPKG